jgi:hypothetical protein
LAVALLLGLCLLGAIAFAAQRSPRAAPSTARLAVGCALVVVPLPLAVAFHLFLSPAWALDQVAFAVGVAAFGAGALLVLPWPDGEDGAESTDQLGPMPWWPQFEDEFRAYERRLRGRVQG